MRLQIKLISSMYTRQQLILSNSTLLKTDFRQSLRFYIHNSRKTLFQYHPSQGLMDA